MVNDAVVVSFEQAVHDAMAGTPAFKTNLAIVKTGIIYPGGHTRIGLNRKLREDTLLETVEATAIDLWIRGNENHSDALCLRSVIYKIAMVDCGIVCVINQPDSNTAIDKPAIADGIDCLGT